MSTTEQAVINAKLALESAEDAARKQRVREAEEQLAKLRRDAKKLKAELNSISGRVAEGDRIVMSARDQLHNIDGEIAQLRSERGKDVLLDPEDIATEIETLRKRREQVFERLKAGEAMTAGRQRAIEIASTLTQMQHAAANLKNLIENGGKPKNGWEGGIFRV